MKQFDIPAFYRSPIISKVKNIRKTADPRKKDFTPTALDFGAAKFYIARHFGFCYGVENAIEISYKALQENEGKRIFLLSQMIHNPLVNEDLESHGIRFLQDTEGNELIPFSELTPEDVVIVPAFGTTLEIENKMNTIGVDVQQYNTTCPFVEKVWNRSRKLGKNSHTIIIHGKHKHEETRATFSHSSANAPSVVVKDLEETKQLKKFITGESSKEAFYSEFKGKFSEGFNPAVHFDKVGVVNQTTMLATETQEIADYIKNVMLDLHGAENIKSHFADTRDTLCYATNDNQNATYGLMEAHADLAIVVGGFNSSNTTHLVELLEEKYPTYFIRSAADILDINTIQHFDIHKKEIIKTRDFMNKHTQPKIVLTSGASCPDASVDEVLQKLLSYFDDPKPVETVLQEIATEHSK